MSLGPPGSERQQPGSQDVPGGRASVCEYFFVVDDNARYAFAPGASQDKLEGSIASEVLGALMTFKPAVMAIPCVVEQNRTAGMRTVRDAYISGADDPNPASTGRVYPLTGFDNGNVLFHHSLMPFILPFAPHHKDGLHVEGTLAAIWLQFFLPRMYQSHALVLATVQSADCISLDSPLRPEHPKIS